MKDRKRSAVGLRNGNVKLTETQIKNIRKDKIHSQLYIALKYNTSQANISLIKRRKGWRHI